MPTAPKGVPSKPGQGVRIPDEERIRIVSYATTNDCGYKRTAKDLGYKPTTVQRILNEWKARGHCKARAGYRLGAKGRGKKLEEEPEPRPLQDPGKGKRIPDDERARIVTYSLVHNCGYKKTAKDLGLKQTTVQRIIKEYKTRGHCRPQPGYRTGSKNRKKDGQTDDDDPDKVAEEDPNKQAKKRSAAAVRKRKQLQPPMDLGLPMDLYSMGGMSGMGTGPSMGMNGGLSMHNMPSDDTSQIPPRSTLSHLLVPTPAFPAPPQHSSYAVPSSPSHHGQHSQHHQSSSSRSSLPFHNQPLPSSGQHGFPPQGQQPSASSAHSQQPHQPHQPFPPAAPFGQYGQSFGQSGHSFAQANGPFAQQNPSFGQQSSQPFASSASSFSSQHPFGAQRSFEYGAASHHHHHAPPPPPFQSLGAQVHTPM